MIRTTIEFDGPSRATIGDDLFIMIAAWLLVITMTHRIPLSVM